MSSDRTMGESASHEGLGFIHRFERGHGSNAAATLLLLHGTGADENDLLPLGRHLLGGASMLSPRGKVLENGAPRFFRRLAAGVFDVDDLIERAGELAAFVRAATSAYGLAPDKLVAVGFSNGANIAAATMLLHPGVLPAAVLLRAMVPLEPDPQPDLSGSRVLISSGRADPMVPSDNVERLAGLFRSTGADVTLHWHPAGHSLARGEDEQVRRWIADHLSAVEARAR